MNLSNILGNLGGLGTMLGLQAKPQVQQQETVNSAEVLENRNHSTTARELAQTTNANEAKPSDNPDKKSLLKKLESLITSQTASLKLLDELKSLITNIFNKNEKAGTNNQTQEVRAETTESVGELAGFEQMLKDITNSVATDADKASTNEAQVNLNSEDPLTQLTQLLGASAQAQQAA